MVANRRIEAGAACTHLQVLSHLAVDGDLASPDGEAALHLRLGSELHVTAGDTRVSSPLAVEPHAAARGIQAAIDIGIESELASGRHLIAVHGSASGDPAAGEKRISRRAFGQVHIRAGLEYVVAEHRSGRIACVGGQCLQSNPQPEATEQRQRRSTTECHRPSRALFLLFLGPRARGRKSYRPGRPTRIARSSVPDSVSAAVAPPRR